MGCCGDPETFARETREPLKYDPEFAGPTRNRSCTDIFWLIIFLVFLGGWVYVGYHGYMRGDAQRLLAPTDSLGYKCGLDAGFEDKPYLVFFDIIRCATPEVAITGCNTPQVCVEKCPDANILFSEVTSPNQTTFDQLVCKYTVNKSAISTYAQMMQLISSGDCAAYVLDSQSVLGRCIGTDLSMLSCNGAPPATAAPTFPPRPQATVASQHSPDQVCVRDPQKVRSMVQSRANALDSFVGLVVAGWVTYFTSKTPEIQNLSVMIVEDLVSARYYMLAAVGLVILVCFAYVLVLRWVVAPVVWFSLLGLIALLSYGIYRCYYNYLYIKEYTQSLTNLVAIVESIFYKRETWMVLLVLCSLLTLILLLVVIFLRKRITIAIALIEEGSKAVTSNKTTIFYPLLPWLLQCGVVIFGVASFVYLLSVGESRYKVVRLAEDADCQCSSYTDGDFCTPQEFTNQCASVSTNGQCSNATCHYSYNEIPNYIYSFLFVNLLGFFWFLAFIQGMADLTLAGTFSRWYWTFNKRNVPFFSLSKGIYTSIRYHMGTVALGSLIIAIVQVIRVFLEYVDRKLKKFDNALTRCILCACKCCFFCLENFLKFINKNAYIMCAVHGDGFCASARKAFNLLMRNIVRVFVLDKVTDFIFLVSKLLIAGGTGVAVYHLMSWNYFYSELGAQRLHFNAVPAVVLAVVAYFVAMLFFNVYTIAVDTLFLCFLEDCERNDGSPDRPYYMSKNLMKILGKRNKRA